jgi:hypothetical protein
VRVEAAHPAVVMKSRPLDSIGPVLSRTWITFDVVLAGQLIMLALPVAITGWHIASIDEDFPINYSKLQHVTYDRECQVTSTGIRKANNRLSCG